MKTRTSKACCWIMLVLAIVALPCAGQRRGGRPKPDPGDSTGKLKKYDTHYYVVYTDLPVETVREAAVRLKAMAEEYNRRTRGFAGTVRRRLPFYMFSKAEDYHAAGGLPGSAGIYNGIKLMALASPKYGDGVWRVVQHEGFHQFARTVIRGRLPVWVNEGLAEYFGHGVWTGDGLVTGLIPPGRMRRVQAMIKTNRTMDFLDMLKMSQKEWNGQLSGRNYDQAWAMTHFLVHADDGKYRKSFGKFINDISSGRPWGAAFVMRFGRDTASFQKRFSDWWLALPARPTPRVRDQAVVQTLASFLARATARKQKFANFAEFLTKAGEGKLDLPANSDQWLPAKLLSSAVAKAGKMTGWSLLPGDKKNRKNRWPQIVFTGADGKALTASFELKRGKVVKVTVVTSVPKAARGGAKKASGGSS